MTGANSMTLRARPPISGQRHGLPVGFVRAAASSQTQAVPIRAATEREISFGPFRLLPSQRLLTKAGREVRVGSRVLDILISLLEHPGRLVTRREFMEQVWPDTVVVRQISTSISPRYVGP